MHHPHKTHGVPDHMIFLGAFAALAGVAAYAFHARPDVQRPATTQRAPAAKTAVDTSALTSEHWMLGIREAGPNEPKPVAIADTPVAPQQGEVVLAAQPQAPTVTAVDAPRHRSHARRHSYAHAGSWPSGSGGGRSLASLPPPGD